MTINRMRSVAVTFILGAVLGWGQKTPQPITPPQFLDNAGQVLSGGCLYTYVAGGTTPQTTYTSSTGGASNTNPVRLNSAGRANIWLTPGNSYRFDMYQEDGSGNCSTGNVLLWSVDNVVGTSLSGASTVTANYVYAGPTTGAAAIPTFRALVAADLPSITATTCTNQFIRVISTGILGTCASVTGAYFGSAITGRTVLSNNTASAAAPAFNSTVDVLAYQVAEIPSSVKVASDFVTSGVGTALEAITGLTWTIPATTALNIPFSCSLIYSQAVANDAVAFGLRDVTVSPTNIAAMARINTTTTAATAGAVTGLASTTATAVVSATPGATATKYLATISGMIEAPSNASSSAIQIMVSTNTAADLVTVYRGSFCQLN